MRILCIRGENLASLEGPFEVRLDQGALAGDGVFAIVGPTGAGKSTLLDAMCLALFADTPHLEGRGGAKVGREGDADKLGENDVRGLLRHGAGHGFAEVDYRGADGQEYTARWEVHRARRRASGKLQPAKRSLLRADGTIVEAGTTNTATAIEDTLGLTYDQFTRTVLLAQGGFARFLHAKAAERSSLLEMMTGTEIYGRLSKAAHVQAGSTAQVYDTLVERSNEETPMTSDERGELDATLETIKAQRAVAQARVARAEAAARWHSAHQEMSAAVELARRELVERREAVAQAKPLRDDLARLEAARDLGPVVREWDKAASSATARAAAAEDATGAAHAADQARRDAVEQHRGADEALARLQRAGVANETPLRLARALDASLSQCAQSLDSASKASAECTERLATMQARVTGARTEHTEAVAERAQLREWRQAHADVEPLAAAWPAVSDALLALSQCKLQSAREEATGAEAALERAKEHRRTAEATEREAALALEEASGGEAAAQRTLAECEAVSPTALEECGQRIHAYDGAIARLKTRREATEAVDQWRLKSAGVAASLDDLRDAALTAEGDLARCQARREEAERIEEAARATMSFEDHRATLVDGEACPLCGSAEHPFAEGAALRALADTARSQLAAARESESTARTRVERHRTALALAEREASRCEEALTDARLQSDRLEELWKSERDALGVDEDVSQADLQDLRDAKVRERDAIARRAKERAELEENVRAASARRDAAQRRVDAARLAVRAATEAHSSAKEALAARMTRLEHAQEKRTASVSKLVPVLGVAETWEPSFVAAPEATLARLGEDVARWNSNREQEQAASDRESAAAQALAATEPVLAERRDELEAAQAREASVLAERARLTKERAAFLGGRAVDEVEAEHATAVKAASEKREQLAALCTQAATAHATAAARAVEAAQEHARAQEAKSVADAELQRALQAAALDETTARQLLSRDGERAGIAARLESLKTALAEAGATLAEREGKLCAHQRTPPELDAAAARTELNLAREALPALEESFVAARLAVSEDDRRRTKHAALADELEAARLERDRWASLKTLIGSSDGKKLREFAQGLTLEHLLIHSNHQLAALRARYALQRIPESDLELQVIDRDMGDEVRSVQSLSGGETFLVSLSLALGLSSLMAGRTEVQSLFIDEGFGTLDAESLDTALDVLDNLRASGRQVGIISHVDAVAERFGEATVTVERLGAGTSRVVVGS